MPRVVTLSVDHERADALLGPLKALEGVIAVQVYRNASIQDPGDVLQILVTNRCLPRLMDLLGKAEADRPSSLTISEPAAVYSKTRQLLIEQDQIESLWEESEMFLHRSSLVSHNFLILMACGGGLAAAGLLVNTLPLILGAAVLMPAFAPMASLGWGLGLRSRPMLRHGFAGIVYGYLTALAAAMVVALALRGAGLATIRHFLDFPLLSYWASFSATSFLVAGLAALAGAAIVTTHRSVLTAGVLIALSLVPTTGIIGIALTAGLWTLAARGAGKWLLEAAVIVAVSALTVWVKNRLLHRRQPWY